MKLSDGLQLLSCIESELEYKNNILKRFAIPVSLILLRYFIVK